MKIKLESLLNMFLKKNDWVTTIELCSYFGVSARTIRRYLNKINQDYDNKVILSSKNGYRINSELYNEIKQQNSFKHLAETPNQRFNYIIQILLTNKKQINFDNLMDQLFISDVTLESDLKRVKSFISNYDLKIKKKDNFLFLEGTEINRRKLISFLVNSENGKNFTYSKSFTFLLKDHDIYKLKKEVSKILKNNDFFINDYGLNNIILHLIITIKRISEENSITEKVSIEKIKNTKEFKVIQEIHLIINKKFNIKLSDSELYHLTLTISSSSNMLDYSLINFYNIHEFIEEKYISIAKNAIQKLEKNYFLESFDYEFLIKFIIHIRGMYKRIEMGSFIKNPLVYNIKQDFPLIYDMAVFIAHQFSKDENIFINEDEITFIAFHIGVYFEKNKNYKNKVTCILLFSKYYDLHQILLDKLHKNFEDDIEIIAISHEDDFEIADIKADLIINTRNNDTENFTANMIHTSIFFSSNDIVLLRNKINKLKQKKKKENLAKHLPNFINKELLKREFYCNDEFEMIETLAMECYQLGLVNEEFKDEVIKREILSSTSFGNMVAVPHSMKQNAHSSFLYFVINSKKMQWGNYEVNIIVLIGINENDRNSLRTIFDDLIKIFSEPENFEKLLKYKNYSDFINIIMDLIINL